MLVPGLCGKVDFMLIPFDYLFKKFHIQCKGVLHIGAHYGEEAPAYESVGIKEVIWIEALPQAFGILSQNMKKYSGMVHHCICACISDVDGEDVTFNVASNEGQSSSYLQFGTHAREHPTVKYVTQIPMKTDRVDTLLERWALEVGSGWFLNIDLQGAELKALKSMEDLLNRFDFAYIEVNAKELYVGCPLVADIDNYLAAFGFTGVETKMTGSGWGDKLYRRSA